MKTLQILFESYTGILLGFEPGGGPKTDFHFRHMDWVIFWDLAPSLVRVFLSDLAWAVSPD